MTIPKKLSIIGLLIIIASSIVLAYDYEVIWNTWAQNYDYHITSNLSGETLTINNLSVSPACAQNEILKTDANGFLVCAADATGAGGSQWPINYTTLVNNSETLTVNQTWLDSLYTRTVNLFTSTVINTLFGDINQTKSSHANVAANFTFLDQKINLTNTTSNINDLFPDNNLSVDVDTNFSTACSDGEHGDGSGICLNTNDTIDARLATTYYNVTNASAVAGTIEGTLNLISHNDGAYDGVTVNITESAGSPGLDVRMNFTGITSFNRGVIRYYTTELKGEYPVIQLISCDDSDWEDYPVVGSSPTFATIEQVVYDGDSHICDGVVQMRLYKSSNGNTQNIYYVDWVAISKGVAIPAGEETDPFSIHRDGTVTLTADWDAGSYYISALGFNGTWNGSDDYTLTTDIAYIANASNCADGEYLDGSGECIDINKTISDVIYNGSITLTDSNASNCADGEYLDGDGNCRNLNNSIIDAALNGTLTFGNDTQDIFNVVQNGTFAYASTGFNPIDYWNMSLGLLGFTNLTVCGDNEIIKMNGAAWNCEADATGGAGGADTDWLDTGNQLNANTTTVNATLFTNDGNTNMSQAGFSTIGTSNASDFYADGVLVTTIANASNCADGEYLDGDGNCRNLNNTIMSVALNGTISFGGNDTDEIRAAVNESGITYNVSVPCSLISQDIGGGDTDFCEDATAAGAGGGDADWLDTGNQLNANTTAVNATIFTNDGKTNMSQAGFSTLGTSNASAFYANGVLITTIANASNCGDGEYLDGNGECIDINKTISGVIFNGSITLTDSNASNCGDGEVLEGDGTCRNLNNSIGAVLLNTTLSVIANASNCADGEYLDGDGNCRNLNNTIIDVIFNGSIAVEDTKWTPNTTTIINNSDYLTVNQTWLDSLFTRTINLFTRTQTNVLLADINSSHTVDTDTKWTYNTTTLVNNSDTLTINQTWSDSIYVQRSIWVTHDNYPAACTNQFVRGLGDILTCASVDSADIASNAVKDDEMDYTAVTLDDFTNDGNYTKNDTSADILGLNVSQQADFMRNLTVSIKNKVCYDNTTCTIWTSWNGSCLIQHTPTTEIKQGRAC